MLFCYFVNSARTVVPSSEWIRFRRFKFEIISGQDKSVVAKTLRLRFLSPAIVHRIVTGDIPRSLTLKDLRTSFPDVWSEQEERWFGGEMASWGEE